MYSYPLTLSNMRRTLLKVASPQTSFGVRSWRFHFSPTSVGEKWIRHERIPTDVCGEAILKADLKVNSREPNRSSEREIKFRRCLFTTSIKPFSRRNRVQWQQKNVLKIVTHVRSCCFACYCFLADVIQTWNGEGGTNAVNGKINNGNKRKNLTWIYWFYCVSVLKILFFPLSLLSPLPLPLPLPLLKFPNYPLTTLKMQSYSNVFCFLLWRKQITKKHNPPTKRPIFWTESNKESKWHLAPSMRVKWEKSLSTSQSVYVWGYIVSSTLHVVTLNSCIHRNYKI